MEGSMSYSAQAGPSEKDHGKMKRRTSASDEWAARIPGSSSRRDGRMLHNTEHHGRMKHELGSHEAYPGNAL